MESILSSWRTLYAFLIRDLIAQYGRHNIGFLWAILEPMILCTGVAAMWTVIKPDYVHGIPVLLFVITGYMPLTLFRHLTGPFPRLFRRCTPLLMHRQLDLYDIFLSRTVLEFAGSTLAFAIIYGFLYFTHQAEGIQDIRLVVWGWVLLGFFSAGLGACFAAVSEYSETFVHFVGPFQYLTVPLSPTFYMTDWLPERAQVILYYNPLAHPYEMIRAGFLGENMPTHYDPKVTIIGGLVLLAIGFSQIEAVRDRLHDV